MTEHATTAGTDLEDVESFRLRARAWLAENMPRLVPGENDNLEALMQRGDGIWPRARELQRLLYDGGFAGICFPREYGGLGLTRAHQAAFNQEVAGYEMPLRLNIPTFAIVGATILDMGTEDQKKARLGAMIRGEEAFVQFLSEPRGGSDLAGAITRATRDGDVFILNGSKIWSSGDYGADYALCLTRTDWEAPKHRGLTMLLVKVHQPGITIRRIKQVNGNEEFCQEFFDDVEIPLANVVGEINGGWAVASRQLLHERTAVGGGSPYVSGPTDIGGARSTSPSKLISMVRDTNRANDTRARELVAESHALARVQQHLIDRVVTGMRTGDMPPASAAIIRLFSGESTTRRAEIGLELADSHGVVSPLGEVGTRENGEAFLFRQASSLGGGSTEMARNIISERILGMPREDAADRDVPLHQVRQSKA